MHYCIIALITRATGQAIVMLLWLLFCCLLIGGLEVIVVCTLVWLATVTSGHLCGHLQYRYVGNIFSTHTIYFLGLCLSCWYPERDPTQHTLLNCARYITPLFYTFLLQGLRFFGTSIGILVHGRCRFKKSNYEVKLKYWDCDFKKLKYTWFNFGNYPLWSSLFVQWHTAPSASASVETLPQTCYWREPKHIQCAPMW